MIKNDTEKIISKFFDTDLSKSEKSSLKNDIKNNPELANTVNDVRKIRDLIFGYSKKSFEPFFEDKVISKINALNPESELLYFDKLLTLLFKRTLAVTLLVIFFIMMINVLSNGSLSIDTALGLPKVNLTEIYDPATMIVME